MEFNSQFKNEMKWNLTIKRNLFIIYKMKLIIKKKWN